jgi:hypothetical protein
MVLFMNADLPADDEDQILLPYTSPIWGICAQTSYAMHIRLRRILRR